MGPTNCVRIWGPCCAHARYPLKRSPGRGGAGVSCVCQRGQLARHLLNLQDTVKLPDTVAGKHVQSMSYNYIGCKLGQKGFPSLWSFPVALVSESANQKATTYTKTEGLFQAGFGLDLADLVSFLCIDSVSLLYGRLFFKGLALRSSVEWSSYESSVRLLRRNIPVMY